MKSSDQSSKITTQRPSKSRLRWEMISSALKGQVLNNKNPASIRRFSSFCLFDKKEVNLSGENPDDEKWFYFSLNDKDINFKIKLKLASNKIPIREIFHSFDNSGCCYVWPAEETLSYFCIKNNFLFNNLKVCELGCGCVAFAGLSVAISSFADYVLLTDGNIRCIENVNQIIKENQESFGQTKVECKQLKWTLMNSDNEDEISDDLKSKFDVILCSDCLYFEKSHQMLLETIYSLLNDKGICIITAPLRQHTFKDFMKLSCKLFNSIKIHLVYDDTVYKFNRKFQIELNDIYEIDLHYPYMGILSKS